MLMPVSSSAGRKLSSGTGAGVDEGTGEGTVDEEGTGDEEGTDEGEGTGEGTDAGDQRGVTITMGEIDGGGGTGGGTGCLCGGRGRISTEDSDTGLAVPGSPRRNTMKARTATPTIIPIIKSIAPLDDEGAGAEGSFGASCSYAYGYIPGSMFTLVTRPLFCDLYAPQTKNFFFGRGGQPERDSPCDVEKKFGVPISQKKGNKGAKNNPKRTPKKWSCV
jgi:hypothetical protein